MFDVAKIQNISDIGNFFETFLRKGTKKAPTQTLKTCFSRKERSGCWSGRCGWDEQESQPCVYAVRGLRFALPGGDALLLFDFEVNPTGNVHALVHGVAQGHFLAELLFPAEG